jgi:hypothetical protein
MSIKLSALLAMLLLAFTVIGGTGAGAQDEGMSLEDLEGLQHSVNRVYTVDYSAMMDDMSSPDAEMQMPTGVVSLSGVILEFESDDNAEAALDVIKDQAGVDLAGSEENVEEIELDLGDNSISYGGTEDVDGQEMQSVITLVQQDNYAYFVYGVGSDEDMESVVSDFTNTLIDNDGSGEGEFNEDGTSSGGLWDKFPGADDEAVSGLIPYDQVIFPVPESTPES